MRHFGIHKQNKILILVLSLTTFFLPSFFFGTGRAEAEMQRLRVSDNHRFLVKEDGTPFFWMGDTAWSIVTISQSDIDFYLNDRESKGFNLIHIDADAYNSPDYNNQRPFLNNNSDTPNEAWWSYLDQIVTKAENQGMYACIFTRWAQVFQGGNWGDCNNFIGGYGIFMNANKDVDDAAKGKAYRFGKMIGDRYKSHANVVWSVSGEYEKFCNRTDATIEKYRPLFDNVAKGIEDAYAAQGLNPLMTIHPASILDDSSSYHFHNSNWLDFNMLQTSHTRDLGALETYAIIAHDYGLTPVKPTLEGESLYEGFIANDAAAVRRKLYWSVFAGGFGVTYGNGCVQDMRNPLEGNCNNTWKTALNSPVANQVRHLRSLMESLPDYLNRIPDQSMIMSNNADNPQHMQATRDSGGAYALVYISQGNPVTVNMAKITGDSAVDASWYNPRTGEYTAIGNFPNSGSREFDAPGATAEGNDWVLVLKQAFINGDVNSDGFVNIKDIQLCIKAIINPSSITSEQLAKCQAVALPTDVANIKDIQAIIRKIVSPN